MPLPNSASPGGDYSHIPIPSYEEATSSRPSSSRTYLGPSEVSHDAERQGLLGREGGGGPSSSTSGYRPPTVESARSSFDEIDNLHLDDDDDDDGSGRESMAELRREMSEMEFQDAPTGRHHSKWSLRFSGSFSSLNLGAHLQHIRVPAWLRQYIPSWRNIRASVAPGIEFLRNFKFDTTVVIRIFAIIFVVSMGYLVFFSDIFKVKQNAAHMYQPETLREYILEHLNEGLIRSELYYLTSFDHLPGTEGSYVIGKRMQEKWLQLGYTQVEMERYDVYLDYPNQEGRSISIGAPLDQSLMLEEGQVDDLQNLQQTFVFHGHSADGKATGHLVYASYGTVAEYEMLRSFNVKVEGSVVLIRHGGSEPQLARQIQTAESNGVLGVLVYSDPADQDPDNAPFNGQWRFDGAVARASASDGGLVLGDVLSPGFASLPEEKKRLSLSEARDRKYLPGIPSLPISWLDAQKLLDSIKGIGKNLQDESSFVGAVPYVEWWSGSDASPQVTLENNKDETERQPIYNVLARLQGLEQEAAKLVVGNHRDAWCFGAVDAGSGTAIMLEVSRIFSELTHAGWRPARTIEFVSWDAQTFNMIGSTEHVEQHLEDLRKDAFAYVNIDLAAFGEELVASGSPALQRSLFRILDRLGDEKRNATSLRALWNEQNSKLEPLGGRGDYAPFVNIAGVPSIDLGFRGHSYPWGSCYDSFQMIDETFDPGFYYHKLAAQVWALLILDLVDQPLLLYDFEAYADSMSDAVQKLTSLADTEGIQINSGPLNNAIGGLKEQAKSFHTFEEDWNQIIAQSGGFEQGTVRAQRILYNERCAQFEKNLLDLSEGGGLPGREQFKHVVYAPNLANPHEGVYFPGVREALRNKDAQAAQQQLDKVATIITSASSKLTLD